MVTERDCIEAIEGYPPHVVELMLDEQERQGNPRNVAVFQKKADAGYFEGGFTWGKSVKGPMFWSSIHNGHKFDIISYEPEKEKAEESYIPQIQDISFGTKVDVEMGVGKGKGIKVKRLLAKVIIDEEETFLCISEELYNKILAKRRTTLGLSYHTIESGIKVHSKQEKVKLTLKDISEGKGVGIPPELIEIVN